MFGSHVTEKVSNQ